MQTNRIHFIDGHQILQVLQSAYRKLGEIPVNLTLKLATKCIQQGNVYLGIVSSNAMKALYGEFGDSLFFENIRDFLGVVESPIGRTTPNAEIVKTVTNSPDKMLERNNGIVIRADHVRVENEGSELILSKGSIVNGCQTTMCLIKFAEQECYIPVKVVKTDQSWEITKAANYQTTVPDIDLELARVLRPQLARRAAITAGIHLEVGHNSVFQLIDDIYDRRVVYEETRLLFIGLFSRTPNNVYGPNYTELNPGLISHFYENDPHGQEIFDTVFLLQEALQFGAQDAEKTFTDTAYSDRFKRIFKPDKPAYRCFVCILALSAALGIDLADRESDPVKEYERMSDFLEKTRFFISARKNRFSRYYILAVKTWMQTVVPADVNEAEGQRDMSVRSKRAPFSGMRRNLLMDADLDDWLKRDDESFHP